MNLFDFDNTIYDGESTVDFFFFCLKKKKSLIKYIPLILYNAFLYKIKVLSIEKLYLSVSKMSAVFLSNKNNVDIFVEEFWEKNKVKLKKEIISLISNKDIIITASPDFLIKGVLKFIPTNNVISSIFNIDTGNFDFICFKGKKVEALKEKFPDIIIDNFFTDSLNDLPLINISKKSYLIKNKKIKIIEVD